jgi:hypothetical protein
MRIDRYHHSPVFLLRPFCRLLCSAVYDVQRKTGSEKLPDTTAYNKESRAQTAAKRAVRQTEFT